MTRREKIAGAILAMIAGADYDWRGDRWPWRGALIGLAFWLGVLWVDADPEAKAVRSARP